MKSPFTFGKIAEGSNFTDRAFETKRLKANFDDKVNTILISPRRWGKSSLVNKSASLFQKEKHKHSVMIDLFNIRDEAQFYSYFAKKVIQETSSKPREWMDTATSFLKRLSPKVSFPIDMTNDFEITFELKDKAEDFEDILNLPEKIAHKKKIEIAVCIDEFQNIANFNQPLLFQKRLRASWQKHQDTVYCLYGSQTHMMTTLFEKKSMPFYKFGDVMYLGKIDSSYLTDYIVTQFKNSGKKIDPDYAKQITEEVQCQPYYTQQLSHIIWINTESSVSAEILERSLRELIEQNAPLYIKDIETLSNTQVNFLHMLIKSGRKDIFSKDLIRQFELGTPGNVTKIRSVLINKEIIHLVNSKYELVDPVFRLWLKNIYFKS
ncbi:MAG TPA: ATP-binding protein [Ignavibacteria bacterium]|nr:ATP-binding protein [Ignavibacteria bacterium]